MNIFYPVQTEGCVLSSLALETLSSLPTFSSPTSSFAFFPQPNFPQPPPSSPSFLMGNLLSSGVISPTIPPSSDGEILSHATFSSPAPSSSDNVRYPLSAFAEFYLPLSAKDLFLISRGSTSAGEVVIKEEKEGQGGGAEGGGGEKKSAGGVVAEARVVVEVRFRDVDDLEYMTVVKLRRTGGGEGVGIYVSLVLLRREVKEGGREDEADLTFSLLPPSLPLPLSPRHPTGLSSLAHLSSSTQPSTFLPQPQRPFSHPSPSKPSLPTPPTQSLFHPPQPVHPSPPSPS